MSRSHCQRCGNAHASGACTATVDLTLADDIAGTASAAGGSRRKPSLVDAVVGGKYRVTQLIASGGTSDVYEAVHEGLGRAVAIKALHRGRAAEARAVARFLREASVAAKLKHPNVCEVIDLGRLPDGRPFLVMERLVGETLAERLGREAIIAPGDLARMMTQLLAGLAAVHASGAIHRDLKPANVFLTDPPEESAQTKLLDFGIAQLSTRDHTPITTVGSIVGTVNYMSPEQITGKRKLDARSDIWSVGVIMYEALSGRPPFWSAKRPALVYQITTAPHRPLGDVDPSIPSELAAIVDKALAKEAAGRYSSAVELRRALLELLDSGALQRNQPPPLPSPTALQRTAPPAPVPGDLRVGRSGLPVIDLDGTTEETMAFALMPNRIRGASDAPPARSTVEPPPKAPPRPDQGQRGMTRPGPPSLPAPRPRSPKGR